MSSKLHRATLLATSVIWIGLLTLPAAAQLAPFKVSFVDLNSDGIPGTAAARVDIVWEPGGAPILFGDGLFGFNIVDNLGRHGIVNLDAASQVGATQYVVSFDMGGFINTAGNPPIEFEMEDLLLVDTAAPSVAMWWDGSDHELATAGTDENIIGVHVNTLNPQDFLMVVGGGLLYFTMDDAAGNVQTYSELNVYRVNNAGIVETWFDGPAFGLTANEQIDGICVTNLADKQFYLSSALDGMTIRDGAGGWGYTLNAEDIVWLDVDAAGPPGTYDRGPVMTFNGSTDAPSLASEAIDAVAQGINPAAPVAFFVGPVLKWIKAVLGAAGIVAGFPDGGKFTVEEIDAEEPGWAALHLCRFVEDPNDFTARLEVAWTEEGLSNAQDVRLQLIDAEGSTVIAQVAVYDAWVDDAPWGMGYVDGTGYGWTAEPMPFDGDATLEIDVSGSSVQVYVDDELVAEGQTDIPADSVRIAIAHYDTPETPFGTVTLDYYELGTGVVPCPGDLDGDDDVDLADLAQLLAHYGTPCGATYAEGDLNGDDAVDLADLAELLSYYGTACD